MGGKKDILDSRFNTYLEDGTQLTMIPRTSDGQLLFLLNNVSKMKSDTSLGSRIAEVHNGSSLFTGEAGSGESNARRYMIENDLVEAIISLPDNMFYNTGIGTFIWVLSNKKETRRKGKIQLIDASSMKTPLGRNMGKKNCELSSDQRKDIVKAFLDMQETETSKIFSNNDFGYWSITVERPLRLMVYPFRDIPDNILKKAEMEKYLEALSKIEEGSIFDDWNLFLKKTGLKATLAKKVRPYISERCETAKAIPGEADPDLRDTELIPFNYSGGIEEFIKREVFPYAPDAWVDEKKTKIGYEIIFNKYFKKSIYVRPLKEIADALTDSINETDGLITAILGGM